MFCPDGYETLDDAFLRCGTIALSMYTELYEGVDENISDALVSPEFQEQLGDIWNRLVDFLRSNSLLYVCTPEGRMLRLAQHAITPIYEGVYEEDSHMEMTLRLGRKCADTFAYIDPLCFIVDIGRINPLIGDKAWHEARLKSLLPINGLPVCWKLPNGSISEAEFSEIISTLNLPQSSKQETHEKHEIKTIGRINAEKEVTRKLMEKFDTKTLKSKDLEMSDFMREYETRLSKNGFLRAWAEAAKARPNMSKPGPKS